MPHARFSDREGPAAAVPNTRPEPRKRTKPPLSISLHLSPPIQSRITGRSCSYPKPLDARRARGTPPFPAFSPATCRDHPQNVPAGNKRQLTRLQLPTPEPQTDLPAVTCATGTHLRPAITKQIPIQPLTPDLPALVLPCSRNPPSTRSDRPPFPSKSRDHTFFSPAAAGLVKDRCRF